jgi:hypothetical protein
MNQKYKTLFLSPVSGEEGSAIIYAIIMLLLLTILGISSINTTTTEQAIAQNDMHYKMSFYAAESAREFVPPNTALYHSLNVTVGVGVQFPGVGDGLDNDNDGSVDEADEGTIDKVEINSIQSFDGEVFYSGSSQPPRGSGYEAGSYKAHKYRLTGNGYGSRNTERSIEAGFYRIGF